MEDRPFRLVLRFSGAASPHRQPALPFPIPPLLEPFLLGTPHSHCISKTQGTPSPALQYWKHSIYSRGMTSFPTRREASSFPQAK